MAQVAESIIVEIRAVVDQHEQATKELAAATERDMAVVEGAVNKAADTTEAAAERSADAMEQSAKQREQAAKTVGQAEAAAAEKADAAAKTISQAADRAADATQESADRSRQAGQINGLAQMNAAIAYVEGSKKSIAALEATARAAESSATREASAAQRAAAAGRQMAGAANGPSGRGGNLQNVSFQLQDFIVQVSSGTGALRAFSQQAPQLLSGFGQWGAVLGIAAAGVSVLATALGADFGSAADHAKEAQLSFNEAVEASRGSYSAAEQQALDLASKLSLVERGFLALAQAKIQQAIDDNLKTLKDAAAAARDTASEIEAQLGKASLRNSSVTDLGAVITIDPEAQKRIVALKEQIDQLTAKLRDPNLSGEQLGQIALQLRGMTDAAKSVGIDLAPVIKSVTDLGQASLTQSDNFKVLKDTQDRVNASQTVWAGLLRELGFTLPEATGHVNGLAGALDGYIGRLLRLNSASSAIPNSINGVVAGLRQDVAQMGDTVKAQQDYTDRQQAMTQGQAAWTEELKNSANPLKALAAFQQAYTLQITKTQKQQAAAQQGKSTAEQDLDNLKAQAAALDGTKAASQKVAAEQRATAAANAAYSKSLAETGDESKAAAIKSATYAAQLQIETKNQLASGGAAKASAAAKQAARTDSALLNIQQETDLNRQLIAVYSQGPDALARQKAAYDALNSARQLGYKIGTQEHAQYVQQYQDIAEQKRQSDLVLADYAKGADLTKASMTAQEAYAASLKDLNRLRDEGAISAETYHRQQVKLDADNSGYVEGIQAVGQAIQSGIQGATSFGDALLKVGLSLAQLLLQAAAFGGSSGGGPFGKLFDSLLGTVGGLVGGLVGGGGGAGPNVAGLVPSQSTLPHLAGGGQALPGQIYQVGETGREWFAPQVPGQVIPNSVIKNAAGGGGGAGGPPIQFNISMAGANGDRAIAEIAAAAVKKGLQSVPEINRQHSIRFA